MKNIYIKCKKCEKEYQLSTFLYHIKIYHNDMNDIELSKLKELNYQKLNFLSNQFIDYVYNHKLVSNVKECSRFIGKYGPQFNNLLNLIKKFKNIQNIDVDTFFNYYLPFKNKNPKNVNSLQLAIIICRGNQVIGKQFYQKIFKPINPYTNHDGTLSPWSKNFVGYKNLSQQQKNNARRQKCFCKDREDFQSSLKQNSLLHIQYYLKKGYTEEQAKKMLKNRQSTFSLQKCIKKYGNELGLKRFKQRQQKWLNSLNTKENIEKIKKGQLKGILNSSKKGYSNISQQCFKQIQKRLDSNLKIYYAENNGEYIVDCSPVKHPRLDFYIPQLNKWIEFDGDYWHGQKRGNKQRDKDRQQNIFKNMPNIELKRIKQKDYKDNPQKIINECVNWILNKNEK